MQVSSLPLHINVLENAGSLLVEWFENNFMKLNQKNCHLIISEYKHEGIGVKLRKKLLGKERIGGYWVVLHWQTLSALGSFS